MITLDYQNVMASKVGALHGIDAGDLDRAIAATGGLCRRFGEESAQGLYGFALLPHDDAPARAVLNFAAERRGTVKNFVQIGIGGSALGAVALHSALAGKEPPRFYCLDNVDPEEAHALFEKVDPKETLYHIVTKSGDTTETMAGFLVALHRLREVLGEKWKKNLVFTTDPEKGFLRKFAREQAIPTFDLPGNVGGRFSVLTPVGLLPAAMMGVDPVAILAGARRADEVSKRIDPRRNPAFLFALIAHLLDTKKGKRIHVMMSYSRALRDVADWFRQLWAESLGKNPNVGPTPVLALGATDQHSQVQLYTEGPNDKFTIFLECAKFRADLRIPAALPQDAPPAFLYGRSFSDVLAAMKSGTESALTQAQRPNATLRFDEISAGSLGEIFYLLEAATLYAGRLYDVNPFDQPGVEAGKRTAFGILGKPGAVKPPPAVPDPRYIVD
jgi:glucose-6-phosphate isomerase